MRAVAYNPEFARRVGIPQSVGKEFHSEDRKMKGKGYAKGGGIAGLRKSLKDLTDKELADELAKIDDGTGPKEADYIDRRGRIHDANPGPDSPKRRYQDLLDERVRRNPPRVGGLAKGGPTERLGQLLAKQRAPAGGPPAAPRGPLFRDSYGTEYNTPEELLVGIREAVGEESDEPRWEEAVAMLQKVPGSEKAQQALMQLQQNFDNPKADIDTMLSMWGQALDELSRAKPAGFAKGGAVSRLAKSLQEAQERGDTETVKRLQRQLKQQAPDSDAEKKGRDMKLSTFAKGGAVSTKKRLSKLKKAIQPNRSKQPQPPKNYEPYGTDEPETDSNRR